MRGLIFTAIILALATPSYAADTPTDAQGFTSPKTNAAIGKLIRSACHQMACDWIKVEKITPLLTTAGGVLYKVSERTYQRVYPDDEPYAAPAAAGPGRHAKQGTAEMYVYCSREHPSIVWHAEAAYSPSHAPLWIGHLLLPGNIDWTGYVASNYAPYFAACHGLVTDTIGDPKATEAAGRRLGYHEIRIPDRDYQFYFESLADYEASLDAP